MNGLQDLFITRGIGPCSRQGQYATTTTSQELRLGVQTADWVFAAAEKLEALKSFHKGWDSYGGLPLKREAKALTLRVLEWLGSHDLPVPSVVLGSSGTIQLEWRAKGKELEIELRDNNTIEYVTVALDGKIDEGESDRDLSAKLVELASWFQRS